MPPMFSVIWYQWQKSNFAFAEDKLNVEIHHEAKSTWKWL